MVIAKRDKTDNLYRELQEITLEKLQELCGNKWTDYNVHDPGITIADYFNYGLFELNYRLNQPYEAYLSGQSGKSAELDRKGLLPKEELFSESIVTVQDYEVLLTDSIKIDNIRIKVRFNKHTRLYDIFVDNVKFDNELTPEKLEAKIKSLYHSHRNLCENIGQVYHDTDSADDSDKYKKVRNDGRFNYEYPKFDETVSEIKQDIKPFSSDYHSIQFDFPENYGIGERGMPVGSHHTDTTKILQLKAYMLIYDHLLADTLLQVQNISELMEFSGHMAGISIPKIEIPDAGKIIDEDKKEQIYLHSKEHYERQKTTYLNMLDALYGENTRHFFKKDGYGQQYINEKRAGLIRDMPQFNAGRLKSFNIHDKHSVPTLQHVMNRLWGSNHKENTGTDTFGKYGLRIVSDKEFYEKYRFLQNTAFAIDIEETTTLLDVQETAAVYEDRNFHKLRMNINLLWYNVLFESFLKYGDDRNNYKILQLPENEYLLVFRHPESHEWINMGLFFSTVEKLTETANLFWQFIRKIKHRETRSNFYFIEHILLNEKEKESHNLLTIVIHRSDNDNIVLIENFLEERLPIHITSAVIYIDADTMIHFEILYKNWRAALASGNEEHISHNNMVLRTFLASNTHKKKYL